MRAVAGSLLVNAALLALLAMLRIHAAAPPRREPIEIEVVPFAAAQPVPDVRSPDRGAPTAQTPDVRRADHRTARVALADTRTRAAQRASAWGEIAVRVEARGEGSPSSGGIEDGVAGGVTCGCESGVIGGGLPPVPVPPAEPVAKPPSLGRDAKLVWPPREEEIDEDHLYIARITVDEDGDVVGVRMLKTQPGARGDFAANAIWTFRYAPARDPSGRAMRSTFDQRFQIR